VGSGGLIVGPVENVMDDDEMYEMDAWNEGVSEYLMGYPPPSDPRELAGYNSAKEVYGDAS